MNKKAANTQLIASMILILTAIIFGMMLLNIGNRFVNQGAIYSKYHLMETSYIFQTIYFAPSSVFLEYDFDLSNFNFYFDDDKYIVESKGFSSDETNFPRDKNVDIIIGPFSRPNYFVKTSNLIFSENKGNIQDYLCPNKDTSIQDPTILIGVLNNDIIHKTRIDNYYYYINDYFDNVRYNDYTENPETQVEYNLSIIISDFENENDIIIYYKPNIMSAKFACIIFNKINEINFNDINMVLVPSNDIYSDIQININFESNNIGNLHIQIQSKLKETIEVYFK